MNEKKLGLVLSLLCIALIVLSGFLYVATHTGNPKITFSGEKPVYTKEISKKELLANVKASDLKDGDLTDKVFVADVSVRKSGAHVTYMVKDSDNHIKSKTQILKVEESSDKEEEQQAEEEKKKAEEEAAKQAAEEEAQQQAAQEDVNPEAPVIKLNTDAATLKVGEKFDYSKYIESISDNKDTLADLEKSIQVEGADTSTTGTKEVKYYVNDKDGNRSPDAILKLTVE